VKANQVTYPIATMCHTLGVSSSGYHAWKIRPTSKRAIEDAAMTERIRAFHARSRGTYGAPRIHQDLFEEGAHVGRKRIARLMRLAGLCGVSRRKRCRTTIRGKEVHAIPDLVERNFTATAPDQLWVADITHTSRRGPGSCTWRSSWTPAPGGSWDGRWKRICVPNWCSTP